jgi:hypothetical protein
MNSNVPEIPSEAPSGGSPLNLEKRLLKKIDELEF